MTSTVKDALYIHLSAFLFIIAVAYAVSNITSAGLAFNDLQPTHTTYFKETQIPEEPPFTGAEVVGSLYKLNFDGLKVVVDGVEINTAQEFIDKQQQIILSAFYKQSLIFNTDGTIVAIHYTRQ